MIRNIFELQRFKTFEERYEYLRLDGHVGQSIFGYDRYLNQLLYRCNRWRAARRPVIIRDEGCDLGMLDREILDKIIIHHMNPITIEDIEEERDEVFDTNLLICTADNTHRAIHYGDKSLLIQLPTERRRNDTCPWR